MHLSSTTEVARADRRASGRRASGQFISQGLMHVVLLAMAVLALAPFVWSIFASFKPFKELVSSQNLLPHTWTLNNYREIFTRAHFLDAAQNSIIAAVSVTAVTLLTSSAGPATSVTAPRLRRPLRLLARRAQPIAAGRSRRSR